ncbi:YecA family protein [Sporosarcina sp. Te-1]|uniref:YecA family protein n=1 Tax=Sporosarcina sp. Te-1 TaxID=2818390 RepID=UPI001A9D564F|nr:SEC-C metal-binding domain-containing protein [Sporosarcina sp. Te-1]QTD40572.1 SEC-C domain-containing protein [Sporosarcina sp. Te-1]
MVGRNDPCPCGSGKKYKRCCGAKGEGLVDLLVNEELDQVLVTFFEKYPKTEERPAMMKLLREWLNRLSDSWTKEDIEAAASEFFLFIQQPHGWQSYIKEQTAKAKRKSLQTVLETWSTPFLLLAEVERAETDVLVVRQLFTEEAYCLVRNEGMPGDEGMLLFGTVLPDPRKGEDAIAPISSIIFLARWSKQTKQSLLQLREQHASKEAACFLQEHAIDIYELFIKRSTASLNELVEEVLAPSQVEALQAFEVALRELEQDGSTRELVHKLAVAFFMNEEQEHISINDFVAAAVWTGSKKGIIRDIVMTDEEIALRSELGKYERVRPTVNKFI